ncbi:GDSL-type esterase/lipase family protein [Sulfurimonas sp.]|nr:GDSL-type esterase/lipase family protein [Sulfurimonas sp.]
MILAFGDSLTYGFGAGSDFSYPKQMQNKTGLKIINAGINGEFSAEGLERLPMFLEHKPELVILCHGGNDIINKLSTVELKENLLDMIQLIQDSGAKVLLIGVPNFGLFGFDTHEVYEEVADETNVLYEDEVLTSIQKDNSLKSDYVHPNKDGYEMMATRFIEVLKIKERE